MNKRTALAAVAALMLPACHDMLAPREPRIPLGDRPLFDHGSNMFAIAYQSCGFNQYPVFECYILRRFADGTFRAYGSGSPVTFHEDGSITGGSWLQRPTWAPDASKIAADNDDDVFVIALADSNFTTLTNHPARDYSAAWSPEGTRIAFISERDGLRSLYVMRAADGANVTRLTTGVEVRSKPSWSPDASRLVFACSAAGAGSDVCVVNADGTGFARLTTTGDSGEPDWSPDGMRIAFVTFRFTGSAEVATMAPDGSNVTRITWLNSSGPYPYYGYANLDWSPDGTRIAFSKYAVPPIVCDAWGPCYNEPGIFVMNADGSGAGQIGAGSSPEWQPGVAYPPPVGDQPPVARLTFSCTWLDCDFYGYTSTDDHGISGYRWNFGDGTTDYNYNSPYSVIFHRYAVPGTYQVTLTVSDISGQSATVTQVVTLQSQAPVASFTSSCGAGRSCSFNSSASTDDRGIVSRIWSFGDGSTVNDVIAPSHSFAVNGSYQVTLTVRDDAGQSNSVTQTVSVHDDPPVARFTYSCAAGTCTFDGRASTDDWGIASYRWQVRQVTAEGSEVTIALKGRSSFTATLTVTDQAGQTNSTTQTITQK